MSADGQTGDTDDLCNTLLASIFALAAMGVKSRATLTPQTESSSALILLRNLKISRVEFRVQL